MNDVHDNDNLEELLVRSGDYLMERTAQYREQSVHTSTVRQDAPRRYRRVVVGTAAAATLCVTALAGSFIGGTSSGKVDVAQAAWSAIPATPTAEQVKKVQLACDITANEPATIDSVPPDYMLEPAMVDVRGTTTIAAYFTWTQATLCVQFADGSINARQLPMVRPNEFAWQKPAYFEMEVEDTPATMIVGFLPPHQMGTGTSSIQESDILTQWEAYIEGPGVERTKASVSPSMERFVAWVPSIGNWTVTFVNTMTGEERVVEDLVTGNDVPWPISPETTVVVGPNG